MNRKDGHVFYYHTSLRPHRIPTTYPITLPSCPSFFHFTLGGAAAESVEANLLPDATTSPGLTNGSAPSISLATKHPLHLLEQTQGLPLLVIYHCREAAQVIPINSYSIAYDVLIVFCKVHSVTLPETGGTTCILRSQKATQANCFPISAQ